MPITANGISGSSDCSAASTLASARFDSSRPTFREIGEPEQVARADAQQLAPLEAAEPVAPGPVVLAPVERVERVVDRAPRASARRASVVVVGE